MAHLITSSQTKKGKNEVGSNGIYLSVEAFTFDNKSKKMAFCD